MNRVLVCPVAYNEHVKLESVIDRFLESPVSKEADYLIVDDASDDGTSEVIARFATSGVNTVRHPKRLGVGAAIRTGIKYARENHYDVIVIMAGNNKDDPNEIPRLLGPIFDNGCEFVQGSRYIGDGGIGGDMPGYRKFATKLHPWMMSVLSGVKVTDSTNGFRAIKLSVFQDPCIDIDQAWLDRYELEPYLMFKVLTLGKKYAEAPVKKIYPPKKLGYTKIKPVTDWWRIMRPMFYLKLGIKR